LLKSKNWRRIQSNALVKVKVLFVHQNLTGDTGESVETKQAIYSLLRQGAIVGALYRRYDAPAIQHSAGNYIDLGCPDFSFSSIAGKIDSFQPDIGHIKSCWTPFHAKAGWLMHRRRIPYVIEPGGHFLPVHFTTRFAGRPFGAWRKILKIGYRRLVDKPLLEHSALVRALSCHEADSLTSRFRVKTTALPLGINEEYYIDSPPVRSVGQMEKTVFLFIGRLDTFQKGLDLILNASRILNDSGLKDAYEVVLAGPPLNESDIQLTREIEKLHLDNVRILPPVRGLEKIALFKSCHVFLHPSRFEEMAKLPREALATGLPIIASRESNLGDWAESGRFGTSVALSEESLARGMLRFLDDRELVSSCSLAAIEFAQKYSWTLVANGLAEIYSHTLRQ
jgi:glycosyltransferase involved in cell wall biosynthesis